MTGIPHRSDVRNILYTSLFFALLFAAFALPMHRADAATSDNMAGWAWSDNIGWISFNCTNTSSCGVSDYGVNMNTSTGNLSGYGWSDNIGWVSFNVTSGCPESGCTTQPAVALSTGVVSGWARALSYGGGWDGWIKLGGPWSPSPVISSSGSSGYSWGSDVVGWALWSQVRVTVTVPAAPTGLSATASSCGTGTISVSWTAVSGATSYTLRDGATVLATTTSAAYSHTGLVAGSSHSYTVRANNSGGSSAYSTAVTGTAPSVCNVGPDLTAGTVSPTSATAGTAVTLSATITNSGTASTGVGFTDLFEINPNSIPATFAGIQSLRTFLSGVLAAGAGNTATASFTFPSAGTWYVRACADTTTSNTGVITESNEGNNCSPSWTAVTVTSSGGDPSLSCSRSPSNASLPAPATVTYTAVASGGAASPYTFRNALNTVLQSGSSLTYQTTYSTAGSYAVTVGASNVSPPVSCGTSLTVTSGGCSGSLSPTITATPSRVQIGDTSDIAWTASGVNTSCVISGTDGYSNTVSASACSIPNGSTDPDRTINAQTTYCITCDSKTAEQKCVIVNVIPDFDEF